MMSSPSPHVQACLEHLLYTTKKRLIFVAGTDTDVGKTYITAQLAKAALTLGKDPYVLKPIQTGVKTLEETDAAWVAHTVAHATGKPIAWQVNAQFPIPATPAVADTQQSLSPEKIIQGIDLWVEAAFKNPQSIVFCELAGGLRVPLCSQWSNLELLKHYASSTMSHFAQESSIVLVARTALGTLNHTLLAAERCLSETLPLHAILLNHGALGGYQAQMQAYQEAVSTVKAQLTPWLPQSVPIYGPILSE